MILRWLVVLQLLLSNCPCTATTFIIYMFRSNGTFVEIFDDCTAASADFGKKITDEEQTLCATPVDPPHACTPVSPLSPNTSAYCINGVYALAKRGNCSFALKAHNVQEAKFAGVLVINDEEELLTMAGDGEYDRDVNIPALMITRKCGFKLIIEYPFEKGFGLIIRLWWSYGNALRFLVPFVVVIGLCFFILLGVVGVRWHRSQSQLRRRRLSKRQLRSLPIKEFKKGDTAETCAICLEDFVDGDKMRLLICGHRYHCGCVDPWLLKRRKICPICKRKALDGSADDSDSDSLEEQATPNESSPLLSSGGENSPTDNPRVHVGNSVFYADYGSTRRCSLGSPSGEARTLSYDRPRAVRDNESQPRINLSPELAEAQPGCSGVLQDGIANPSFVKEEDSAGDSANFANARGSRSVSELEQ